MRLHRIVPALALLATPLAAQQSPGLSGTSSYTIVPATKNCTFGWRTVNVRYLHVGSTMIRDMPHLVMEERTSVVQCENLEGPTSTSLTVVARPATRPSAAPVWTIRDTAEVGGLADDLQGEQMYRTTRYGCCGAENLDRYWSLRTGRRVFQADRPLLWLSVTGFGEGYIALHDAQAADGGPGGERDRTQVLVIAFGQPDTTVQRVSVRGPSSDFWVPSAELVARGPNNQVKRGPKLDIDSGVGAGWTVALAVRLESMRDGALAGTIEIPIEHGRMVTERARVPAPFRLVR